VQAEVGPPRVVEPTLRKCAQDWDNSGFGKIRKGGATRPCYVLEERSLTLILNLKLHTRIRTYPPQHIFELCDFP
jgi:hypothetical protein